MPAGVVGRDVGPPQYWSRGHGDSNAAVFTQSMPAHARDTSVAQRLKQARWERPRRGMKLLEYPQVRDVG